MPSSDKTTYAYDGDGRLGEVSHSFGETEVTKKFAYDAQGRLVSCEQRQPLASGEVDNESSAVEYGADGDPIKVSEKASRSRTVWTFIGAGRTAAYPAPVYVWPHTPERVWLGQRGQAVTVSLTGYSPRTYEQSFVFGAGGRIEAEMDGSTTFDFQYECR